MPRKRVKREEIPTERKRNTIFKKRIQSFTKKANDLSILCGVEIGIVIHKPLTQNNSVLWPSPEIFGERLRKFLDVSNLERSKKMVVHENYLDHRLKDETEDLVKSRYKKDLKESQEIMGDVLMGKGFDDIDLVQLDIVQSFAVEMVKKLKNRDLELNKEQGMQSLPLIRIGTSDNAAGGGSES